MSISLITLKETDILSLSRTIINDNFNILKNEINLIEQFIDPVVGVVKQNVSAYKVYSCLISQHGESDPFIEILENTIGEITVTRLDVGRYLIYSTNAFIRNKTAPDNLYTKLFSTGETAEYKRISNNLLAINTYNNVNVLSDSVLNKFFLDIKVYNGYSANTQYWMDINTYFATSYTNTIDIIKGDNISTTTPSIDWGDNNTIEISTGNQSYTNTYADGGSFSTFVTLTDNITSITLNNIYITTMDGIFPPTLTSFTLINSSVDFFSTKFNEGLSELYIYDNSIKYFDYTIFPSTISIIQMNDNFITAGCVTDILTELSNIQKYPSFTELYLRSSMLAASPDIESYKNMKDTRTDVTISVNDSFSFEMTMSSPGSVNIDLIITSGNGTIDWGDGSALDALHSGILSYSHSYTIAGTYTGLVKLPTGTQSITINTRNLTGFDIVLSALTSVTTITLDGCYLETFDITYFNSSFFELYLRDNYLTKSAVDNILSKLLDTTIAEDLSAIYLLNQNPSGTDFTQSVLDALVAARPGLTLDIS